MTNHPNRTLKIGTRVEARTDVVEDYDTGTIVPADGKRPLPDMVCVAWDSGVRTWTPRSEIRAI